jgi:hypothetical protein
MSTEELICTQCGICTTEPVLSQSGVHTKASCPECGAYIKFISTSTGPAMLYFGKYKGQTVESIAQQDPEYLRWLYAQGWTKPKLRKLIDDAFQSVKQV